MTQFDALIDVGTIVDWLETYQTVVTDATEFDIGVNLESSGALFGTIFVDREALSDEALEQIEAGDEEVVEA